GSFDFARRLASLRMTLHSVRGADQVQDSRVSRSGRIATDQKAVRRRGPGRVVLGSKPQLATTEINSCAGLWSKGGAAGSHSIGEVVVDLVPAELFFEVVDARVLVDDDALDAGYVGEVLEGFDGERLAETRVVGGTGQDPRLGGGGQVRARLPD